MEPDQERSADAEGTGHRILDLRPGAIVHSLTQIMGGWILFEERQLLIPEAMQSQTFRSFIRKRWQTMIKRWSELQPFGPIGRAILLVPIGVGFVVDQVAMTINALFLHARKRV